MTCRSAKGQCDIRLQVDDEVEVTLRGDTVFISHDFRPRRLR